MPLIFFACLPDVITSSWSISAEYAFWSTKAQHRYESAAGALMNNMKLCTEVLYGRTGRTDAIQFQLDTVWWSTYHVCRALHPVALLHIPDTQKEIRQTNI